jgi:ElaB/YqjD/DUF883 family membrane-anchored ribosome-binding protein
MTSTMEERKQKDGSESSEIRQEIEDLKKAQAVQVATDTGAHATQAAVQAGAQAAQAAATAGLGIAVVAGAAGLVVGMLLGSLFTRS